MDLQLDINKTNIKEEIKKYENHKKSGLWLVKYHANWCGHCKNMQPEWINFKQNNKSNINIAEIESDAIELMENKPDIIGFPTIRIYKNGQKINDLKGERTSKNISSFVKENINGNQVGGKKKRKIYTLKKNNKKKLLIPFRQILKKKDKRKTKKKNVLKKKKTRSKKFRY